MHINKYTFSSIPQQYSRMKNTENYSENAELKTMFKTTQIQLQ